MAETVQIQGSSAQGKVRNPLGVIGLALVTLGIYAFVWYYKTNREMAEIGRVRGTEECGTSPGTSLLAMTLGAFVIVPPFFSYYGSAKRLQASERATGTPEGMEPGLLFLLLVLLGPVGAYIYQSNLNKVLRQQAESGVQPSAPPPEWPEAPERTSP